LHESTRNGLFPGSTSRKRPRSPSKGSEASDSSLNLARMQSYDTVISHAQSLPCVHAKHVDFEDFDLFSPSWTEEALRQPAKAQNIQKMFARQQQDASFHEAPKLDDYTLIADKPAWSSHSLTWPACVISNDIPVDTRVAQFFAKGAFLLWPVWQFISKGTASLEHMFGQRVAPIKSPSMDEALRGISKFEIAHPNFGVLALDISAPTEQSLFLAQNFKCIMFVGEVAKNMPNSTIRPLIPESALIHFLRHAFFCIRFANGQEVIFSCRVNLLVGEALLKLSMCFENGVLLVGGYVG